MPLQTPDSRMVRLAVMVSSDQKNWLESQASRQRSLAQVVRDILTTAMSQASQPEG